MVIITPVRCCMFFGSFEVVVSVIHIASDPVAQFYACAYVRACACVCVCVVVTQMLGVWSMEPQHPGFRNPAWLTRAFTLPVDRLRSSTVL